MLRILDRYIVRQFLYSYAVSLVALLSLVVIFDALGQIENFRRAAGTGNPLVGTLSLMMRYYAVRLPLIFHAVCPAILLIGAMFAMAQLNRNNELMAMRAAGISIYRALAPLFFMTVVITGVLVADQELLIPSLLNQIRGVDELLAGGDRNVHKRLNKTDRYGNRVKVAYYRAYDRKMEGDVHISAYYPGSSELRLEVKAREGTWKRMQDGKERWVLSDGQIIARYNNQTEIPPREWRAWGVEPEFGKDGFVLLRPDDHAAGIFEVQSDLTPQDMIPGDATLTLRSTADIRRHLENSPGDTELSVTLAARYAFPFANLVLLLLGLPFVLGTESRSTFVGLAICIAICAAFYGINTLCVELGRRGSLTPTAAAWLPIVLFMPTGFLLFDGVKS